MAAKIQNPHQALIVAFLKQKPVRADIEEFKDGLVKMLDSAKAGESEEFHKNLVRDFLQNTEIGAGHFINTQERKDLVIHHSGSADSEIAVIIETKSPTNKSEMVSAENLNGKAMYELLLYYLDERIGKENKNLKHLIITDFYHWIIFDAHEFERLFAQNKKTDQAYSDFKTGRAGGKNNDFFYKEIAPEIVRSAAEEIVLTTFDLRTYETVIRKKVKPGQALTKEDEDEQNRLIALYKILSPVHLLKESFANDSNTLDQDFYSELLHLIGFEEVQSKGQKIISRKKEKDRNPASLFESAVSRLQTSGKLNDLSEPENYGKDEEEQAEEIARQLVILWINRILFLKLLESQLLAYNKREKEIDKYRFLNTKKVPNFHQLETLFYQVLAVKTEERKTEHKLKFAHVPYLNSSLFDAAYLEKNGVFISQLDSSRELPIFKGSVLNTKDQKKPILAYIFEFLDAYDFTSEGSEAISEERKTLINAAVLGLVFEKINGYKDGSFFTPGFITMYMSRETLRRAVVQKFKELENEQIESFEDLQAYAKRFFKPADILRFNAHINSLKICDPAVGSGHFLVSVLNELIALKHDLGILADEKGIGFSYQIEVQNDELTVVDAYGKPYEYIFTDTEISRFQKTLFSEKRTLIENCLFGVDINPNSVNICRLRLWIELLKNAYYKEAGEPETLPNIDINIKVGNSLVSLFGLNGSNGNQPASLKKQLKTLTQKYKDQVIIYKSTKDSAVKRQVEKEIARLKSEFTAAANPKDEDFKILRAKKAELGEQPLFFDREDQLNWIAKTEKLATEVLDLEAVYENKIQTIYRKAFEWRFEFPEVLDEDGNFTGFDLIIGNPPYIRQEELQELKPYFKNFFKLYTGTSDIYIFFIEKAFEILKKGGVFSYIMPNKFMQAAYGKPARQFILEKNLIEIIDLGDYQIFNEATTYPCVLIAENAAPQKTFSASVINAPNFKKNFGGFVKSTRNILNHSSLSEDAWVISGAKDQLLLEKMKRKGEKLSDYVNNSALYGIKTGLTEAFVIDESLANNIISQNPDSKDFILPFLLGRDVKPYAVSIPSKKLIKFEKGYTRKNCRKEAPEKWFAKTHPVLNKHLLNFKEKAEKRTDQGDFYWELRACDYYKQFKKPKIMYQKFQVKPCFIYDNTGLLCNDSMWVIPTKDKVLLGILNSKTAWWLVSKYCTAIQNGYQLIWKYFGQIPIAKGDKEIRTSITKKVNQILAAKKKNPEAETAALEAEIDRLVYELYDLTAEEIAIVEAAVK